MGAPIRPPIALKFQAFHRPRPSVIVAAHERSGTHFLMNTLAHCFGYVATPWIDFDYSSVNINFHSARRVAGFFKQFHGYNVASLFKSHHNYAFFQPVIEEVLGEFIVFYVYRDPRDVMVSYWKLVAGLPWHEGPKTATCREFVRAAPEGQMLRYQTRQAPSLLHRWRAHVDGWTREVPAGLRHRVCFVRYEDLHGRYEASVDAIATFLSEKPLSYRRPSPRENVVFPSQGTIGAHREHFDQADLDWFREVAGETMTRLGYG
jgi:hypothetical protein